MAELKFKPVRHSHKEFLAKAATRKGFVEAYDALALEYQGRRPNAQGSLSCWSDARRRCGTDGNNQECGFEA
jgi:hypothetical protein